MRHMKLRLRALRLWLCYFKGSCATPMRTPERDLSLDFQEPREQRKPTVDLRDYAYTR